MWNPSELSVCTPSATVNQHVPHMPICINTAVVCLSVVYFGLRRRISPCAEQVDPEQIPRLSLITETDELLTLIQSIRRHPTQVN